MCTYFFNFVLHSFCPDTGSTPISFSVSRLLQFATAAESLTFFTKLIFCKTIPGKQISHVTPTVPFSVALPVFSGIAIVRFDCFYLFVYLSVFLG